MSRYIDVAETAKMIRVALKQKFPGIKFSVKSSRYAGGASINVHWFNGPTRKEVQAVTGPYEGSGFDGMIDMAYSKGAYLLPDGTAVYGWSQGTTGSRGSNAPYQEPLPAGAEKVHFGSDYVHCERSYTDSFIAPLIEEYKRDYGNGEKIVYEPSHETKWGTVGPSIKVVPWDADLQSHIYRFIEERSEQDGKHRGL